MNQDMKPPTVGPKGGAGDSGAYTGEVRSVSATGGEKGVKPERFSLLPWKALGVIAAHFGVGALKYADHNWRKGYEWSKSYDALQRHLTVWWEGEDIDEETGSSHLAAAGFHILVLITFAVTHKSRYARFDTRYKEEPEPEQTFVNGGTVPGKNILPQNWARGSGGVGSSSGVQVVELSPENRDLLRSLVHAEAYAGRPVKDIPQA